VDQLLQDATQAKDRAQDPPRVVDAAQVPPPSRELEAEPNQEDTPTDRVEDRISSEVVSSPVSTPERKQTKYGLRARSGLTASSRLMFLSSGRAPLEGRVM
jgi:hypothetical protein